MSKIVLLIDDDANVRTVVQISLEDIAGWAVTAVDSGQAGLETLGQLKPDLILLDMMMPGLDGPQTLERIKANGHAAIPVIFMTAKAAPRELEYCLALGVAGVITKPFDPLTLARQIEALLP